MVLRCAARWMLVGFLVSAAFPSARQAAAAEARILKVLPHFLDQHGRTALSPSLFERDAYQLLLRENPGKVSAVRFDVQAKRLPKKAGLMLRLELRGSKLGLGEARTFETPAVVKGWLSSWTKMNLSKEDYAALGLITAWRATVWDGPTLLAEQQSFLW